MKQEQRSKLIDSRARDLCRIKWPLKAWPCDFVKREGSDMADRLSEEDAAACTQEAEAQLLREGKIA